MEDDPKEHPIYSEFQNMKAKDLVSVIETKNTDNTEETLSQRFLRERKEWKEKVSMLAKRISDIWKLADLQTDVYSERQALVEYYHYLVSLLGKKNAELRKLKRKKYEFYTDGYHLKLDKDIKLEYIMTDLEDTYHIKDELENHMKFVSETMRTVDNIIFGIKHRITLEEYKRTL